ncbi:MFS transporter [Embleya sp. NBC_00888]|uniref:MFS transporter n=1 Tax=Embleya sp. NBC_00888 TaxID=2975960 RepID=UPI003869A416|nr:MFS transporter [Embleya sp. NBC_00888]
MIDKEDTGLPPLLYLLAAGAFFVGTDVFVVVGLLPEMAKSWEVSVAAAGQLMTVFSITYAVLGPVISGVTAGISRCTSLVFALGAMALGNVVCAEADSLAAAMGGRVLVAIGACQFTPQVAALAAGLVSEGRRGKALSIITGGLVAGSVIGVPAGVWIADLFDWQITLWVLAVGSAGVAGGLGMYLQVPSAQGRSSTRERLASLGERDIRLVLTVTLLAVIAEYGVYTYAGAVFERATHGDGALLGVLLLAFGIGGMVGNAIAGALMDRPAGRHLVLVSVGGMALNFAFLPFTSRTFVTALLAMSVWGVVGWMYAAPQQHRLLRLAGSAGPVAVSMNSSIIYVGAAFGGAAGGGILGRLDARWIAFPATVVCVLAVVAELRFRREDFSRKT